MNTVLVKPAAVARTSILHEKRSVEGWGARRERVMVFEEDCSRVRSFEWRSWMEDWSGGRSEAS